MIEIKGTLLAEDYVSAQYLHLRPRPIFRIFGIIVLALFLWAGWYSLTSGEPDVLDYIFFLAMGYLILNFAVYLPWKTRRIYRQQKALQRELTMKFDEVGVNAENENGRSRTSWEDFHKWKANDQLILLYLSDCLYHMVPKRFFTDVGDFEQLRELLPGKIGSSGR